MKTLLCLLTTLVAAGCNAPPKPIPPASALPYSLDKEFSESRRVRVESYRGGGSGYGLSVLSANFARETNGEDVVACLKRTFGGHLPDIIVMQEMMCVPLRNKGKTVAEVVAEKLGYNVVSFVRGGLSREAVAILSKLPFDDGIESVRKRLAAHDLEKLPSADGRVYQRMGLMVNYRHPRLGRVRVCPVHLAHHEKFVEQRTIQIRQLLRINRSLEKRAPADVVILAGDFNTGYDEPFYGGEFAFLEGEGFRQNGGPTATWIPEDGSAPCRLDYVFWKGAGLDYAREEVGALDFSDHNYVLTHFEV